MVFQCHQERKYMLDKQKHLTNWVPIVCPFTEWNIWPPPFGHWLFSFFPVLAPAVFKFYDGLSQFTCPPSYSKLYVFTYIESCIEIRSIS